MKNKKINNARANARTAVLRATTRLIKSGSRTALAHGDLLILTDPMPTLVGGLDACVSRSVHDRLHAADAALRAAVRAANGRA